LTDPDGHQSKEWVINKSYNVKYSSLEVPPKGVVLFEVGLDTWTELSDGSGACDAAVDSSIMCPFLQFESTEMIQKGPPLP
jgi:hypothetical protein